MISTTNDRCLIIFQQNEWRQSRTRNGYVKFLFITTHAAFFEESVFRDWIEIQRVARKCKSSNFGFVRLVSGNGRRWNFIPIPVDRNIFAQRITFSIFKISQENQVVVIFSLVISDYHLPTWTFVTAASAVPLPSAFAMDAVSWKLVSVFGRIP